MEPRPIKAFMDRLYRNQSAIEHERRGMVSGEIPERSSSGLNETPRLLNLSVHKYPSADGRHWSSAEMAQFVDGNIDQRQMNLLARPRWEAAQWYVPKERRLS